MSFRRIALTDLVINKDNDRHGELPDETAAIAWLLGNRPQHMRNLTRDIVNVGKIYEPPLVAPHEGKYWVFDGNRRVTCLKLLADPHRATTTEFQEFFRKERERWHGAFPMDLLCQVETERDEIDEILYRRHTGAQSGVGQSHWDSVAKSNFVNRTGKKTKINIGEEVDNLLRERAYLTTRKKLPRSNLNRLLSAEAFRNRVGITTRGNKLAFTHDPERVLAALTRIADDLIARRKVLGDIWDNESKRHYLNELEKEGVLPTADDALKAPRKPGEHIGTSPVTTPGAASRKAAPRPLARATLIPSDLDYGVAWTGKTARHREIWRELQHELHLDRHSNAIAVLLRVLLELAVEHYITSRSVAEVHKEDKLAKKVVKAAEHMQSVGLIDKKYLAELKKFDKAEPLISAHTMNSYVHSSTFSPSPNHLTAMWDGLAGFIVHCLNG